jgi:AraC-like DNA-binding protein
MTMRISNIQGSLFSQEMIHMPMIRRDLPHVPMMGRYNYTCAHPALSDHDHPEVIEICLLVKGRQIYRVGGRDYRIRGGDIFVTFPREKHSTGKTPEGKGTLYWMMLRLPQRGEAFLDLPRRQAQALLGALLKMPSRHFRGSRQMRTDLDRATVLFHQPKSPLATLETAQRIRSFLLEVVRCSQRSGGLTRGDSLQILLDYIAQRREERLSVSDLAARARVSVARFSALFKEETGVPPAEYVLRVKVEEARRRLERGEKTVTEIAYELGFSSSQYFATAFKRLEGISPREVRGAL